MTKKSREEIIAAMNRAYDRLENRPKLPFCVNDDDGKPWSSHLMHGDAVRHLRLARAYGIKNPTVTDGNGRDITEIVDGWMKKGKIDV